jgi:predicted lipid-binding transport protein (Tim44 family)
VDGGRTCGRIPRQSPGAWTGIVGALVGGFLSGLFHWSITIVGHPILSAMLIAFIGAVIVLLALRLFRGSGLARGRAYWS